MEEAAVHAVDGLSATPELVFVLGILVILSIVAIKVVPSWQKHRSKKIDIEDSYRKEQLKQEGEFKAAQLAIERDRELRKMSEAKMRHEHDVEQAAINSRMVDAQERSTAAMTALTQQMAVMNGQLEMSKERSSQMGETIDAVAHQVGEIHEVVVRR